MSEIDDVILIDKVRALFAEHNIHFTTNDYWLIHDSGYAISVDASLGERLEHRLSVRLDIDVSLPDGRLITESFVGVGEEVDAAIDDAVDSFKENSLPVFLTAFFKLPPTEMVTMESWKIDGVAWRVIAGNFGTRQSKKELIKDIPEQLFPEIETAIRCSKLRHNSHWFRLFYSQCNRKADLLELLMDNEIWEAAKEPVARVPWQSVDGYYSIRSFVVVMRETPIDIPVLAEDKAIKEGMDMVLKAWQRGDVTEADIYRQLTNSGVSPDLAERLLAFTPIGFSEVYLVGADLPTTYRLMFQEEPGSEQLLEEEPVFVHARALALDTLPELLKKYAAHSDLVKEVESVMEEDEALTPDKLEEFEFVTPDIYMPRFRPETAHRTSWWRKVVDRVSGRQSQA